jgi:hypothetical protein
LESSIGGESEGGAAVGHRSGDATAMAGVLGAEARGALRGAGTAGEDERREEEDVTETVEAVERDDEETLQPSHDCAALPTTARERRSRLRAFSSETARASTAYFGIAPLEDIAASSEAALILFSHFSTSSSQPSTNSYSIPSCW